MLTIFFLACAKIYCTKLLLPRAKKVWRLEEFLGACGKSGIVNTYFYFIREAITSRTNIIITLIITSTLKNGKKNTSVKKPSQKKSKKPSQKKSFSEAKMSTDHEYAFSSFVKNFNDNEEAPNNLDNLALHVTKPGRNPGGAQSLIDHINELTDNDKRAAIEWNNGAVTFKIDSYKPELFGDNILRTHCRGPGHGMENADRFVNNGDVDQQASANRTLGSSWYGVGQKNTAAAAAPFTLAMSVSKIEGDNYLRVHTHLFKMWGYHQTCTLQFDYYPDGPQQGRIECRSTTMLQRFVKMMQPTFLKTVDDIKNWIREEGNETGITRLMIGVRPKFKNLLVNESTAKALVNEMSLTYLYDPNFHVNICGQMVESQFNIEKLITEQHVYECDGYDVIVGRRKISTLPALHDQFMHHKEPSDLILKGPVYVLGGRILQADSTAYMQGHYARYQASQGLHLTNSEKKSATFPKFKKRCVPDDAMQCISFLYANRYANHAFNSKGEEFETMRIGTDIAIFVILKSAERCTAIKNSVKTDDVVDINTYIDKYIFPTMPVFESYHLNLYKENRRLVLEERQKAQDAKTKKKQEEKSILEERQKARDAANAKEALKRLASAAEAKAAKRAALVVAVDAAASTAVVEQETKARTNGSSSSSNSQSKSPPVVDNSGDIRSYASNAVSTIGNKRNRAKTSSVQVVHTPPKKKKARRKFDGHLSNVYLYTLEGSKDWFDEATQQTIYRFGVIDSDPSDYFKEINRQHPTNKIKIVEYWTGVKYSKSCEDDVLGAIHTSTDVQSFKAYATSTNAFIIGKDEEAVAGFIEKQLSLTEHSIKFSKL